MLVRRLILILLLTLAVSAAVFAQPVPARGAYSLGAPFAVPGGLQPRGPVYVVNTTSDQDYFGGLFSCDPTAGVGLTLREAVDYCSAADPVATVYVPAGVYQLHDDLDSSRTHVWIIGEDPLTTIIDNLSDDVLRSAGHGMTLWVDVGESATVANLTFFDSDGNLSGSNLNGGGMLIRGTGGSVSLNNLVFDANTGYNGGGLSIEDGPHQITASNLTFTDNIASGNAGGAIYVHYTAPGGTFSITESVFTGNQATVGGAIYAEGLDHLSLDSVSIMGNTALGTSGTGADYMASAGGLHLVGAAGTQTAFISNSEISLNLAENATLGGGGAGGLFNDYSVYLLNTLIEDNQVAPFGDGPDCFTQSATVELLGGSRISSTDACAITTKTASDQVDNLLENGGFEFAETAPRAPGSAKGWNLKENVKRTCNTSTKTVSNAGGCALSSASGSSASQIVDISSLSPVIGDTYQLSALTKGKNSVKVKFTAIATFSDGTTAAKAKFTVTGAGLTPGYDESSTLLTLNSAALSTMKVKIVNTSISGKTYIDSVYLTYVCNGCIRRDVAPPPAAPVAFRGGS